MEALMTIPRIKVLKMGILESRSRKGVGTSHGGTFTSITCPDGRDFGAAGIYAITTCGYRTSASMVGRRLIAHLSKVSRYIPMLVDPILA